MKYFFSAVVFFISSYAFSGDVDLLNKKLADIKHLAGGFTQHIHDESNTLIEQTQGEFKLKRPGYFLWQTQPPYEQLIVSNPQNLYVFEPDLDQVTVYEATKIRQTPAGILTSKSANIARFFDVSLSKEGNQETYKLVYKQQENQDFEWLKITFTDNRLSGLSILDKLSQTTKVTFTKLDSSVNLDESLFQFVPPKGVDIIKN